MKNWYWRIVKAAVYSLCLSVLGVPLWAGGPAAVVESVKGGVFATLRGKTRALRPGDHLENFSRIMTEEGGRVVFSDYFDHRYTLAGAGQIGLDGRNTKLERGFLWIRSFQKRYTFTVKTANAVVGYKKGSIVVSFDGDDGKSQVLVVEGEATLGSSVEKTMGVDVGEGHFSFIHKDYENGRPREPTPVGFKSFQKVALLFDNFGRGGDILKVGDGARKPSSSAVEEDSPPRNKKRRKALSGYKKALEGMGGEGFKPSYGRRSGVVVQIFGMGRYLSEGRRMPASVPKLGIPKRHPKKPVSSARKPASLSDVNAGADTFERALRKEYKNQMRHKGEVNSLIDSLESYKADYTKSY